MGSGRSRGALPPPLWAGVCRREAGLPRLDAQGGFPWALCSGHRTSEERGPGNCSSPANAREASSTVGTLGSASERDPRSCPGGSAVGDLDLGPVLPGPAALSELLCQAFYLQGPREAGMRKPTCPPRGGTVRRMGTQHSDSLPGPRPRPQPPASSRSREESVVPPPALCPGLFLIKRVVQFG